MTDRVSFLITPGAFYSHVPRPNVNDCPRAIQFGNLIAALEHKMARIPTLS